jgi:predicted phage-related endonuclease
MRETFPDRETWAYGRTRYIGSSDAPGILGCGYASQTRTSVWTDKAHGVKPKFDQSAIERMNQGKIGEKFVLEMCANKHPEWSVTACPPFDLVVCESVPYLASTLDGEANVGGEMIVLEAKVIGAEVAREWDDDLLPLKYYVQVQHQLLCTGRKRGLVIALVAGDYQERWVERNEELLKLMLVEYETFWRHVIDNIPPDDESPKAYDSLRTIVSYGVAKAVGGNLSGCVREALDLEKIVKEMAAKLQRLKANIARESAGFGYLVLDDQSAVKLGKSLKRLTKLPKGVEVK